MSMLEDIAKCRPAAHCRSTFITTRGNSANIVFCQEPTGHAGHHKGFRKQWDNAGNPVKARRAVAKGKR